MTDSGVMARAPGKRPTSKGVAHLTGGVAPGDTTRADRRGAANRGVGQGGGHDAVVVHLETIENRYPCTGAVAAGRAVYLFGEVADQAPPGDAELGGEVHALA